MIDHEQVAGSESRRLVQSHGASASACARGTVSPSMLVAGRATLGALLGLQRAVGNRAVTQFAATAQVVQRQPLPHSSATSLSPASVPTAHPERFPTYEGWIASFRNLETFQSQDTVGADPAPYDRWRREHHRPEPRERTRRPASFNVFGDRPADRRFEPGAGPHATFDRPAAGDAFVDHPTEAWLRRHLPPNLIATAYELPSDCADVAFILRHVWLAAHHRMERHTLNGRPVRIGDRRGTAAHDQVRQQILGPVDSWSFAGLLQPYLGANGRPLRDYARLQALLHPGDVLVWAHHREPGIRPDGRLTPQTGGHVQTVMQVVRSGGRITRLRVVQGNQPIFRPQAEDITRALGAPAAEVDALRNTAGRRVEVQDYATAQLNDDTGGTWTWGDVEHTTLVAAGPMASVPRPTAPGGRRRSHLDRWAPALHRAGPSS